MLRFVTWLIDHRKTVIGLLLLVTGLALLGLSRVSIGTSWARMFFGDDPRYQAYALRVEQFGSDQVISVAYNEPRPLSPDALGRLEAAVRSLTEQADVERVTSLLDAQRVVPAMGAVPYRQLVQQRPEHEATLTAELQKNPLYGGTLIAHDGKAGAMHIALELDPERALERVPALIDAIIASLVAAGFRRESLHPVGLPVVGSELIRQTTFNLQRLLPLCIVILLSSLALLLRQLTPALVATFVGGLASLWTMGFAAFLDPRLSIMTSLVPAMVLIVAFADVIHLWSAYQLELRAGKTKREAILASGDEVGGACLLTSATTFVGFASISLAPAPVFRMLGLLLGVGVGLALFLAVVVVPIVLSYLPVPHAAVDPGRQRRGLGAWLDRLIDRVLVGMATLSTQRPRAVVGVSALVIAIAGWFGSGLSFETDLAARFAEDNRCRQDQRFFEKHFAGTTTSELYIELARGVRLTQPELLALVADYQREVLALPQVDQVISISDLLDTARRAVSGASGQPTSAAEAAILLGLLHGSDGKGPASAFLSHDQRTLRMALRLQTGGVRTISAVSDQIEALGRRRLGGKVERVEVTGLMPVLGRFLDDVISGQREGLLASLCGVTIMLAFAIGGLRPALVAMVPNLLPLLLLAGYIGATVGRIDSDAIIVFTAGIGIAVDDTLHVLLRLQVELERCDDPTEALVRTYRYAGRAIALTTAILGLGFLPFAMSDYFTIRIMGTMLPAILVAALVADLLLLPALFTLGWLRLPRRKRSENA